MSKFLQALNPAQCQAVEAADGPVLVLAGPGSGKTRVLTHRVAYLIEQRGVDPFNILAVTFTNKAAREMKDRLEALVGAQAAYALSVGTFHSLCARFLRRDIVHLGRERNFVIYDGDDQQRLMRRVLREMNVDEKRNPPRSLLARISSAKNELVGPAEYARLNRSSPFDELVATCYQRYQVLLREANALDFDDLLVETVRLFDEHPDVLAHYHTRFTALLVDEYQDTNRAQYLLIRQLAAQQRNLFVVGDDDQSIYLFRGADVRNILQFEQDYPEAQVILLEQNYRSTQSILDIAQAIIQASQKPKHLKRLWTENGGGAHVTLHKAVDQDAEALFVADELVRLIASGDVAARDCAIMYRTNAQSRAVEEALIRRALPYQIVGGTRFYERKEVRDILAYLRVLYNPYDSVSLTRILNWPGRGIGQRTEQELISWAATLGVPLFQALRELEDATTATPFNARTTKALLEFLHLLDHLRSTSQTTPVASVIEQICECIAARATLEREYDLLEAEERWQNLVELRDVAESYKHLPTEAQLPTFLEEVALVAEVDKLDPNADKVTCITLHQAKGLEYAVVFLIGLEEGLLPHSRSAQDRDQLEEERRLLYVGMTRAQRKLYLCHASERMNYGRFNSSRPSRFLSDIPKALLKGVPQRSPKAPAPQTTMFSPRSALGDQKPATGSRTRRPSAAPPPEETRFSRGQQVRHAIFGSGTVIASRLVDGDEEVTVRFNDRERRLLASFANLEQVDA
ncbi:ATP-dependent helicase [Candidatus Viridilinea mediisalina]|uniref:DNA 3'-5' helicase n=1 Tax=Candidatus Viridilinea mediisalina TaxID=2024553 RepID=A0A2A6RIQ6_9CHLR|nr:UvrD-helicase domain-containing protein [Candidatus Viridilinea mediisalina]PDW02902.1 DNA helicase UvrD [Candidatus Viridilinea mediisalina]